jgi:hypothetical protein
MKVWMTKHTLQDFPHTVDFEGPYASAEYVIDTSIWSDQEWRPTEGNRYLSYWEAAGHSIVSELYEVEVEGS